MQKLNTQAALLKHGRLRPKMEPQDYVKLLYQSTFGGGHMIPDSQISLTRLKNEMATTSPGSGEALFEPIGDGFARLNLSPALELPAEAINRIFVTSANSTRGDVDDFRKKLDLLCALTVAGALPLKLPELEAYIAAYEAEGYPAVSHSEKYRAAYSPAYRVVKAEYAPYIDLIARIEALMAEKNQVLVAIDGNSGSGKSTLADLLAPLYEDVNVFHMDDFFLPFERKTPERLAEPGGNVDYERFGAEVIAPLLAGKAFSYRPFSCQHGCLADEAIEVRPAKLNIIEGSYSHHPTLEKAYDVKVMLSINPELQSARILTRNGEFMHRRFMQEWVPLENVYFEHWNIRAKSDFVFEVPSEE